MSILAIDGGTPVRTAPFPRRTPFADREVELATEAIRSQNLFQWSGTKVKGFEEQFAALYGVRHGVSSTSGTAAIHLAVGTIDPNPGDEIITAPITDLGSVTPILQQNAIPVFADIDRTYNMDPEDTERKITDRTRGIIVVHLFGNPANMDAFADISKRHNIPLIEDCSQAHLTVYKGRLLGTIGAIGCFSLQQSKHMTTGDGGMTITDNQVYYERMRFFVDKGFQRRGWGPRAYLFLAPNYRMNELTAAVGLAQLEKVQKVVE
jgi:dTDP-4-amino-4,6-dideoxygalactose transaminase